eukprot:10304464-Karenia_brevis.AAC.1
MCNPQDKSQMAPDMGWSMDADNHLTSEDERRMAEEMGWPVEADDTPELPEHALGSAVCEQGL